MLKTHLPKTQYQKNGYLFGKIQMLRLIEVVIATASLPIGIDDVTGFLSL